MLDRMVQACHFFKLFAIVFNGIDRAGLDAGGAVFGTGHVVSHGIAFNLNGGDNRPPSKPGPVLGVIELPAAAERTQPRLFSSSTLAQKIMTLMNSV